jgi:hypothetical protein
MRDNIREVEVVALRENIIVGVMNPKEEVNDQNQDGDHTLLLPHLLHRRLRCK